MKQDTEIIQVLKELYTISGCRMSLHDTGLREIASYPKALSSFCACLREDPRADQLCRRQDAIAFETVRAQGQIYIYRCPFGLNEAVAPLYHYGVLSGFLMMGQILDTSRADRDPVIRAATPFFKDQVLLRQRAAEIPEIPQDKLRSCISLMNICAAYITLSNRMHRPGRNLAEEIRLYIDQNYSDPVTLESLCRRFYCSRPTLVNAFRKAYGTGINGYLTQVRLRHAQELLQASEEPIRQISLDCGFSTQNYFAKVFFRNFGCTPSAFRAASRVSGPEN